MALSYRDAGVDIDRADRLVDRIRPLAASTRTPWVVADVGGFAGLCALPGDVREPLLVGATDGVGTKLEVAIATGRHDTVGIDLVAMCVNDLVTVGARPLFFLDYFATGRLSVEQAEQVVAGIADGCRRAGCALLGGETAELPGFYDAGRYDLAGFAVGIVERSAVLDGSKVRPGDAIVGVASSGLHANGYSLARRAVLEVAGYALEDHPDALGGASVGEVLLEPTRIYVEAASAALATGAVHAMAHVTGGGLPGNLPRVMPEGTVARLWRDRWPRPAVFDFVQRAGDVEEAEMYRVFNMGLGMVFVVDEQAADDVLAALQGAGEQAWIVGRIEPASDGAPPHVEIEQ